MGRIGRHVNGPWNKKWSEAERLYAAKAIAWLTATATVRKAVITEWGQAALERRNRT